MPVEIDIDHVAKLARLTLTQGEKAQMRTQLSLILEHAAKVGEVAADDILPTAYAIHRSNVLRPDAPEPSIPHAAAMQNAPETDQERFKVVRIVDSDA